MATITFEIPDEKLDEVLDAFGSQPGGGPRIPGTVDTIVERCKEVIVDAVRNRQATIQTREALERVALDLVDRNIADNFDFTL